MWTDYVFPETLAVAIQILDEKKGRARIIAGGTDLVLQSQRGQCDSQIMVDITRISDLSFIEERMDWIYIGPLVTHAQLAESLLIKQKAGILAKACSCVGGPQIRQVATLAGNVANALPAADGAVALFALDAEVQVSNPLGQQWKPIRDFYKGVGECCVDPCHEVISAIRFRPLNEKFSWSYQRLARRRTLILPMLCVAVVLETTDDIFSDARIAIGPVAPVPFRAREAEKFLIGSKIELCNIVEGAKLACQASHPRDSVLRGSAEYRKNMVEILVTRGLHEAIDISAIRKPSL